MANSNIKPIRSEQDYEAALARIDALMDAEPSTSEFDELDILADLVEAYENKHEPMGYPSPIAAIEFRMEQANLSPRDLIPFIGSRAKVSEVLSGKRAITMPMARALHEHLAIPAEVLLHKASDHGDQPLANLEWSRFPLLAMAKLGWIPKGRDLVRNAEAIIQGLIERAGGQNVAGAVLYKKNDHLRANAKMDAYALNAWCWQVLAQANAAKPKAKYKRGTVTLEFLKSLARLSRAEDGPRQAKALLASMAYR
ncbi:MAG: hypothetical protein IPG43_20470 [Proteobacteria bacterium]|nr:hypothetical protein [Pseudomonadota bacterium]